MSQPQAATYAGGDGDHVFESATQFHARKIVVHIDAEGGVTEIFLYARSQCTVCRSNGNYRRMALRNLFGKRWAADRTDLRLETAQPPYHFLNNFSHAQQSVILDALGCAHKEHVRLQPLGHVLEGPAAMVRRHYADNDFRA